MKTAREFLSNDTASVTFRIVCEKAGIVATVRQVRKYLSKKGIAYKCDSSVQIPIERQ